MNRCKGDKYSLEINGNVYNEQNPSGIEIMQNKNGCDSIIYILLHFDDFYQKKLVYQGCKNDGYYIIVNNKKYDESNPKGTETISSINNSCDTIYTIELNYHPVDIKYLKYSGCLGDGYFIKVGNIVYNEKNTEGIEILKNINNCDSTLVIKLEFEDCEKIYEETCKLDVPNIFSPNNDGINDNFYVKFNPECEFTETDVYIFDRWGNLVFYSDKSDFKWNGKKGDEHLNSGVYTYCIKLVTKYSKIKVYSGDITLLN